MTEETRPAPMTPPDCNLRAFEYIPLLIARLRRSRAWLTCKRRPELAFYMINLWTAAWHEVPAASLEADDDVLADLAMCSPEKWPKVRDHALRGWVRCSDGRLYHPVVASLALKSWSASVEHAWKKECDRLRKTNKDREKEGLEPLPMPPKPERVTLPPAPAKPADVARNSNGRKPEVQATSAGIPAENALKGEGREREGKGEVRDNSSVSNETGAAAPPLSPLDQLWRDGPPAIGAMAGQPGDKFRSLIGRWLKAKHPPEQISAAIAKAQGIGTKDPVSFITACLGANRRQPSLDGFVPGEFD